MTGPGPLYLGQHFRNSIPCVWQFPQTLKPIFFRLIPEGHKRSVQHRVRSARARLALGGGFSVRPDNEHAADIKPRRFASSKTACGSGCPSRLSSTNVKSSPAPNTATAVSESQTNCSIASIIPAPFRRKIGKAKPDCGALACAHLASLPALGVLPAPQGSLTFTAQFATFLRPPFAC